MEGMKVFVPVEDTTVSVPAEETTVSVAGVYKTSERSNRWKGHEERCGRRRQID